MLLSYNAIIMLPQKQIEEKSPSSKTTLIFPVQPKYFSARNEPGFSSTSGNPHPNKGPTYLFLQRVLNDKLTER